MFEKSVVANWYTYRRAYTDASNMFSDCKVAGGHHLWHQRRRVCMWTSLSRLVPKEQCIT